MHYHNRTGATMPELNHFFFIGLILTLFSGSVIAHHVAEQSDQWLGWLMVLICGLLLIYLAR